MSGRLRLFFAAMAACALAAGWESDELMDDIVEIGHAKGLQDVVGGDDAVLLVVYAPWCVHSRKAVEGLRGYRKKGVVLAKLNGEFHGDAALTLGTTNYPQILFFAPGKRSPTEQYTGLTTTAEYDKYLSRKLNVPPQGNTDTKLHIAILTEATFEKAVTFPNRFTLVQFLTRESEKAREVASWYETVASAFQDDENVLVAAVDMATNAKTAAKYNLKADESPHFLLFGKGEEVAFKGDPTPEGLLNFINKHTKANRNLDGTLAPTAGLIGNVHVIVAGKIAKPAALKDGLKVAEEILEEQPSHPHAGLYKKILAKAIEKGEVWVIQEIARLQKMINNGDVKGAKKDVFTKRVNILMTLRRLEE